MGPVMNLVLAVVVMAVVLYQGAQVPALRAASRSSSAFTDGSVGAKAGLQPAIASSPSTATPVDTWEQFSIAVGAQGQARSRRSASCATASTLDVTVVPVGQGKYEVGDIGVLPDRASADRGGQSGSAGASRPG